MADLGSSPKAASSHCHEFVMVIGSEPVRLSANESIHQSCKWLRNIAKSKIFKTRQNSRLYYESAALTAELRALHACNIVHPKSLVDIPSVHWDCFTAAALGLVSAGFAATISPIARRQPQCFWDYDASTAGAVNALVSP